MTDSNSLRRLDVCPLCQTPSLYRPLSLLGMFFAGCAVVYLAGEADAGGLDASCLAIATIIGTLAVVFWKTRKVKCRECRRVFLEAESLDSELPHCPYCGTDNVRKRFLAGSIGWGSVALSLALMALVEPVASLLLCLIAIMAFSSPQYTCIECERLFSPPYPLVLDVCCPACNSTLNDATYSMVGDTGVCSKCKLEFEIKPPACRNDTAIDTVSRSV
jgi:Zn finger protein HypA/HybF involved in hydrogenase expression